MHVLALGLAALIGTAGQHAAAAPHREAERAREERLARLREQARIRLEQDRTRFTAAEFADIESRYRSAFLNDLPMFAAPGGTEILAELIRLYPTSNRAGCAALHVRRGQGVDRELRLKQIIADYSDAWCESGVQVGALARALLAVHYVELDRFDEAERLAAEVSARYPGSIDDAGAPLDDLLNGLRLLRVRK